ncbi:hypothetical protein [Streptosporangium sp. NPDC001681]|uniref:hypothetical protein n=1 Tax=Streptosporangium sp. NPDC001681 TaxID=3154395 RepID=UPI00331BC506
MAQLVGIEAEVGFHITCPSRAPRQVADSKLGEQARAPVEQDADRERRNGRLDCAPDEPCSAVLGEFLAVLHEG